MFVRERMWVLLEKRGGNDPNPSKQTGSFTTQLGEQLTVSGHVCVYRQQALNHLRYKLRMSNSSHLSFFPYRPTLIRP